MRYVRERFDVVAAEISSLCSFSHHRGAFQTLKNYYCLLKVTQLFSSHSFFSVSMLSTSLSHWVQSRTILSTPEVCLLIFASWHLSSAAFQEGDLWETLSSTKHSAKLSWCFCAVHCSGQRDTERDNLWLRTVCFFHRRNRKVYLLFFFPLFF